MAMNQKLLPCPFCGGSVARTNADGESYINTFYCDACPVEFSVPYHAKDDFYVRLWNTRENGDEKELTEATSLLKWLLNKSWISKGTVINYANSGYLQAKRILELIN